MDLNTYLTPLLLSANKGVRAINDTDVLMLVKYNGPNASGKIEIDAGGEINFTTGALGAEAADTDVVAATGIIDTNTAASNTMGEIVDIINATGTWEAILVGALRQDSADNVLLPLTAVQAKVAYGIKVYGETSTTLKISLAVDPVMTEIQKGVYGLPFSVDRTEYYCSLLEFVQKNTFGSGTSLFAVWEVDPVNKTEWKVWEEDTAATTVKGTYNFSNFPGGRGLTADAGNYLIARMTGSAACTGYAALIGNQIKW